MRENGGAEDTGAERELVLFKNGAYQNIESFNNATITNGNLVMTASGNDGAGGAIHRTFVTDIKLDLTNYKTLTFSLAEFTINSTYPTSRKVWLGVSSNTIAWQRTMSDLIYRVCKRTIRRGGYPADMQTRLDVFYAGGKLSTAEYDELCGLLEAE